MLINPQAQAFKQLLLYKRRLMSPAQRKRPIRIMAPVFPMASERQMGKDIKQYVMDPITEVLWQVLTKENYERWVADYKRHDTLDPIRDIPLADIFRADAYENEVNRIIGTLKTKTEQLVEHPNSSIQNSLNRLVTATYIHSKGQWENTTKKIIGKQFSTHEPWWQKTRQAWLNENITLIKSQPEEYIKKISDTIYRGVRNGSLWGELKNKLQEINTSMSDNKARLIARDQIGKLNGQLSKYRQTEIGLNYYTWSTVRDERVRDAHKEMEGALCRWDDASVMSWDNGKTWIARPEEMQGLIPGEDIQCFLGETKVRSLVNTQKLYRRRYSGKLTTLVFENGESFACTPNHPILRADGIMFPAQGLNVGDYVNNVPCKVIFPFEKNKENRIPSFQEIFDFLSIVFPIQGITGRVQNFHSDGMIDKQVDIISLESPLGNNVLKKRHKRLFKKFFTEADSAFSFLPSDSQFIQILITLGFPFNSYMSLLSKLFSFINGHFTETDKISLRTVTELNIVLGKNCFDSLPRSFIFPLQEQKAFTVDILFNKKFFRQMFFVMSGSIGMNDSTPQFGKPFSKLIGINSEFSGKLSKIASRSHLPIKIVNKFVREFDVHVFNLQNSLGWYIITDGGFIVKNCRCQAIAYFEDVIEDVDKDNFEEDNREDSMDFSLMSPRQKLDALKIGKVFKRDEAETKEEQLQPKSLKEVDDFLLNDEILNILVGDIYSSVKIDNTRDIPYLAGYSKDGKTIYIDKNCPQFFQYNGRRWDIYPFFILHESIEKVMEDNLKQSYQKAHQIALRIEKEAVESAGLDWEMYDRFCQEHIKTSSHEQLEDLPDDLDIKPYIDENDQAILKDMQKAKTNNLQGSGKGSPQ